MGRDSGFYVDLKQKKKKKDIKAIGSSVKVKGHINLLSDLTGLLTVWGANRNASTVYLNTETRLLLHSKLLHLVKIKIIRSKNNPIPPTPSLPCLYQSRVKPCQRFLLTGEGVNTTPTPRRSPFVAVWKHSRPQSETVDHSTTFEPVSQWGLMIIGLSKLNRYLLI